VPLAAVGAAIVALAAVLIVVIASGNGSPAPTPSRSAASPLPHVLYELDPQTGAITAQIPIGHPAAPEDASGPGGSRHGITTGQGSVWVTNQTDDAVTRIDAASHTVSKAIEASSPNAVVSGSDVVWVANDNGAVTSIDPSSNAPTRVALPTAVAKPLDVVIDPASGEVVVTSLGCFGCPLGEANFAHVAFLDPSGNVAGVVSLRPNPITHSLAILGNDVWVVAGSDLWRIDLHSHQITGRAAIGEGELIGVVADAASHSLWVSVSSLGGQAGSVVRVDAVTRKIAQTLPLGCCPGALALDQGALWVTDSRAGTVTRVDPATGATRVFRVAPGADAVAVGYGHVWVAVDRPGVLG